MHVDVPHAVDGDAERHVLRRRGEHLAVEQPRPPPRRRGCVAHDFAGAVVGRSEVRPRERRPVRLGGGQRVGGAGGGARRRGEPRGRRADERALDDAVAEATLENGAEGEVAAAHRHARAAGEGARQRRGVGDGRRRRRRRVPHLLREVGVAAAVDRAHGDGVARRRPQPAEHEAAALGLAVLAGAQRVVHRLQRQPRLGRPQRVPEDRLAVVARREPLDRERGRRGARERRRLRRVRHVVQPLERVLRLEVVVHQARHLVGVDDRRQVRLPPRVKLRVRRVEELAADQLLLAVPELARVGLAVVLRLWPVALRLGGALLPDRREP